MNKAFVREAEDDTLPKCPACHAIGQPVGPQTLAAHLPPEAASGLAASTNFCPNPTCDIAYFDNHNQTAPAALLQRRTWPKADDLDAVLCPCLNITAGDIVADAERNDPTRLRRMIAEAKERPDRCAALTPNAQPCTGEAQRLYLKNVQR